jgi:cell division protein FtsW
MKRGNKNVREDDTMLKSLFIYTGLLLLVTILLISIGLIMIASTTYASANMFFFKRQLIWIGIGLVGGVIIARIPMTTLVKYSHIFLMVLCVALTYLFVLRFIDKIFGSAVAVKFPLCPSEVVNGTVRGGIKGGFRWLTFPMGVSIQPSEFVKIAILLFLASYYGTRNDETIRSFYKGIIVPMIPTGYALVAIFLGKDLSQTVITAMMVGAVMFLAGVKTRYLTTLCLVAAVAAVCLVMSSDMRRARVKGWLKPQSQTERAHLDQTSRYQLTLSEMALGGGGMWGRGFMQSIMKNSYLPEAHTDFIIAILGEEFGLVGILIVMMLYAGFMICLFGISKLCIDRVSMLICQGIGVLIPFQALINIGVVSGFFPTTGLTAPFISYGGSSSISLLVCMGLVSNVCINNMSMHSTAAQNDTVLPSKLTLNN